jgi:hypothetical protein
MKIEREKKDLMLLDQISQNNSSRSGNAVETMNQNSSIESLDMWKKLLSIRKIIFEVVVLWMRGSWRELEIDKELREFIDAVRGEVQEMSDAILLQAMEVIGIINWTNGDIICDQTLERREVRDDGWSSRKKTMAWTSRKMGEWGMPCLSCSGRTPSVSGRRSVVENQRKEQHSQGLDDFAAREESRTCSSVTISMTFLLGSLREGAGVFEFNEEKYLKRKQQLDWWLQTIQVRDEPKRGRQW